jgi:hypothetical protein
MFEALHDHGNAIIKQLVACSCFRFDSQNLLQLTVTAQPTAVQLANALNCSQTGSHVTSRSAAAAAVS